MFSSIFHSARLDRTVGPPPVSDIYSSWIARGRESRCNIHMGTKSREVIWGGQIMNAKILARSAREAAKKAAREADHAEAYAWSVQMEGYGGPAQPSPTIGQCLNGGLGWLEVECNRCKTRASLPLDAIRRPRDTPIWKLEAALKCRSCRKGRWGTASAHDQTDRNAGDYAVSVVHPDEER
jgi:hypothetical protein